MQLFNRHATGVFTFLIALTLVLSTGCGGGDPKPDTATLDTQEATDVATAQSEDASAGLSETIIIDVRSQDEWDAGHLQVAKHIPHTEIAERIGELTEDKEAEIIVYCKVGGRAGMAKAELEKLGFTNVMNGGGLEEMKKQYE